MTNENEQFKINNIVKDPNIKKLIDEPKEIKSPKWFDKNKFKEILAIIDSNEFNYKNLIKKIKVNLSILTLQTWLIILEIIQIVKQMLKKI